MCASKVYMPTTSWNCIAMCRIPPLGCTQWVRQQSSNPYPEPVYTGMPLECHWLTQCTLGNHWATQRIFAGYTGTPLEKLSWNSPTLECHWRNLVESAPHWDATGETLTFAAYTGTPLEGLWQPTHAPTHIVKHAEKHPCQFEMTRWRDTSKQVDRSLYIQPLLGVYCPAMNNNSALNTCDYFNITLCMLLIWAPL